MEVNKILSEPMHVIALEPGEKAIFRLIGAGEIDPKTKQPRFAAGRSLPGRTNIIDLHDGMKPKLIENVVGFRANRLPDGSIKQETMVERVWFDKTNQIILGAEKNNTYGFLLRHNGCVNNPFRTPGSVDIFFLVNPREKARKMIQDDDIELEARLLVRDATVENLNIIATGLKVNTKTSVDEMRADCLKRAKNDPISVIRASNNVELKAKLQIREAVELNFISYDTRTRVWFWKDSPAKEEITVALPDEKPDEALIKFFSGNDLGAKEYRKLTDKLKRLSSRPL